MILAREQINRYLRHIIMPEISGPGQKKLLDSSVFICGEMVKDAAVAIDYLAAAGVGHISYQFGDYTGIDEFVASIHDLNDDVSIRPADGSHSDFQIFLSKPEFIIKKQELIYASSGPSVIAVYQAWQGGIQVFTERSYVRSFVATLSEVQQVATSEVHDNTLVGEIFSNSVLGALCAMEVIKLSLGIGGSVADFLYFDLLAMDFFKVGKAELNHTLHELCTRTTAACRENKLQDSKVLIVGTGGLGSPAAYALALGGVGTIGLVDYDTVEISNLNRQILHAVSRLGMPKVESAAVYLKKINPGLTINLYNTSLSKDNIFDIIAGYDIVIDAVDNFPTRFLLNDACFFVGKPMIDAGVISFDGTFRTILPHQGPCYRCTLPDIPASGSIPSCAESGVLGPVPGIMGFIQAAETVKVLTCQGNIVSDSMLFFDGRYADFLTVKLKRKANCPLCGTEPTIHELQEYVFRCTDD